MLREEKNVRQIEGEPRRRWFDDEYFDLIVWFQPGDEIWGFQLCYDRERKPRALTWTSVSGYKHTGIDDGEYDAGGYKSSPVLVDDGLFDSGGIGTRFAAEAAELPDHIASFVTEKIKAFKL